MLRPTNHKRSRLQERKAATSFGGETTPGSGNQWHSKGDVKTPNYLIECKCTSKDSFTLKADVWQKIATEALLDSRYPLMEILFIDRDVSLVVLDKDDYINMMHDSELRESIGSEA